MGQQNSPNFFNHRPSFVCLKAFCETGILRPFWGTGVLSARTAANGNAEKTVSAKNWFARQTV